MTESQLRHIALIAEGAIDPSSDPARSVSDACAVAAALVDESFATIPGLAAFSFLSPEIDRLLDDPASAASAARACEGAAQTLAQAAVRKGAALRLCGRLHGLPDSLARLGREGSVHGRTVLWFLRYKGREEIARAAERFLKANPGTRLADSDLDAWLDTAGVPDPDLIVLAGGRLEIKDALVWQGSYAEIWHTSVPWLRFTTAELRAAIEDFAERQRRFGR